jgi:hypothetical protein
MFERFFFFDRPPRGSRRRWQLAIYIEADGNHHGGLDYTPIIAWSIDDDRQVISITPDSDDPPDSQPYAFKSPEGKYVFPSGPTLHTEHEAMEYCIKESEKRKRNRKLGHL